MAGFNRFGGGFGGGANMQNMIRQAQKMQQEMLKKQEELANTEVIGASGGGMVEVVITGKNEIKAVRIKKEAVDPDDVEMLEDLIMAAIKDAQSQVAQLSKDALGPMGGAF
ncbi:MAG: YbaB/EbfC family nucleoid-associated protein [Clostridia bacterium]|nr:YbaB/EbfC family nucleoid-associated protein [Clostridia bacterium]